MTRPGTVDRAANAGVSECVLGSAFEIACEDALHGFVAARDVPCRAALRTLSHSHLPVHSVGAFHRPQRCGAGTSTRYSGPRRDRRWCRISGCTRLGLEHRGLLAPVALLDDELVQSDGNDEYRA